MTQRAATSKVAESTRRGLEEALAYAEGAADTGRYGVHVPAEIDVKAIRVRLKMTQEEFAGWFGFSLETLRHWEQGRRPRDRPAPISLSSTAALQGAQKALRLG